MTDQLLIKCVCDEHTPNQEDNWITWKDAADKRRINQSFVLQREPAKTCGNHCIAICSTISGSMGLYLHKMAAAVASPAGVGAANAGANDGDVEVRVNVEVELTRERGDLSA